MDKLSQLVFDTLKNKNVNTAKNQLSKLKSNISKIYDELTKGYKFCGCCCKFSLPEKWVRSQEEKEIKNVCVYSDCGYGDDDRYADITYLIDYEICPLCKGKEMKYKWEISRKNERGRW